MVLSAKYGKEIADGLIQTIQLNKDYLSEIDAKSVTAIMVSI